MEERLVFAEQSTLAIHLLVADLSVQWILTVTRLRLVFGTNVHQLATPTFVVM